jgi:hypothetical protein
MELEQRWIVSDVKYVYTYVKYSIWCCIPFFLKGPSVVDAGRMAMLATKADLHN